MKDVRVLHFKKMALANEIDVLLFRLFALTKSLSKIEKRDHRTLFITSLSTRTITAEQADHIFNVLLEKEVRLEKKDNIKPKEIEGSNETSS